MTAVLDNIRAAFALADIHGEGVLWKDEVHRTLREVTNLTEPDIDALLSYTNAGKDGKLNYGEFLTWIWGATGSTEAPDRGCPASQASKKFSMCLGSLKLDGMLMSDAALDLVAERLTAPKADIIVWLETDTPRDGRGGWHSLATRLEEKGYVCFLDGGLTTQDGATSPAVDIGKGHVLALLLAVRADIRKECSVSDHILQQGKAGGAKVVLQRSLIIRDASVIVLGTCFSTDDEEKENQINTIRHAGLTNNAALLFSDIGDRKRLAATHIQRVWRGVRDCRAYNSLHDDHEWTKPGRKHTVVCLGDQNTRLVARDSWIKTAEPIVCRDKTVYKLSPAALDELVELLRSEKGRQELCGMSAHFTRPSGGGLAEKMRRMYLPVQWWRERAQSMPIITYKRTPYHQTFPTLAAKGDKQIVTTSELLSKARKQGDQAVTRRVEALADAEIRGFLGADSAILKAEFFGMHDNIPKVNPKVKADMAQTYLNEDGEGNPIYLQVGWLDLVGFAQGEMMTNFRRQTFRFFETVPQVHAFDHLLTIAVIDFEP